MSNRSVSGLVLEACSDSHRIWTVHWLAQRSSTSSRSPRTEARHACILPVCHVPFFLLLDGIHILNCTQMHLLLNSQFSVAGHVIKTLAEAESRVWEYGEGQGERILGSTSYFPNSVPWKSFQCSICLTHLIFIASASRELGHIHFIARYL